MKFPLEHEDGWSIDVPEVSIDELLGSKLPSENVSTPVLIVNTPNHNSTLESDIMNAMETASTPKDTEPTKTIAVKVPEPLWKILKKESIDSGKSLQDYVKHILEVVGQRVQRVDK